MRNSFILFFFIGLIHFNILCQERQTLTEKEKSILTEKKSEIAHAVILKNSIFLASRKHYDSADLIIKYSLKERKPPFITQAASLLNLYYPFSWDIYQKKVFYCSAFGTFSRQYFTIDLDDFELVDSLEVTKQNYNFLRSILEKNPNVTNEQIEEFEIKRARIRAESRQTEAIIPLKDYEKESVYGKTSKSRYLKGNDFDKFVTFDLVALDTHRVEFYLRDHKQITQWEFKFPKDNDENTKDLWQEKITYVSDSIGTFKYAYFKTFKIPLGNHSVYNAIEDSLFFEGHFKVINQGNHKFIINLHHGVIYWLGEKAIHKVGQIDLPSYTRKLKGNKVFIEDRDNKELIFFAPVTQLSKDLPFPKVRLILKDEEFKEMFKNVGG